MTRGEIWWVDFGIPLGSAAGYRRPAVIIQADKYNETSLNTVIVVPFSSNLRLADYKPNVYVESLDSGLSKDSVAIIPLTTALDKSCFKEKISKLPNSIMEEIYDGIIDMVHK